MYAWRLRLLLGPMLGALIGWAGSGWAGHANIPSVVMITPESLKRLLESQRAPLVLVDLRSIQDYRSGRLPGAVSMTFEDVVPRILGVPARSVVVLYCGCPIDVITPLYDRLRNLGHRNLVVLQDGFEGWAERGYPVER